jgi:hypothetical protein
MKSISTRSMGMIGAAITSLVIVQSAGAAAITAGNVVMYRTGTGAAALGTTATAVFLDEYSPAGTLVQSIPVTTTGASALTAVGNAGTEGNISPSQDGTKLVFAGYRADTGTAAPTASTVNRVIGTLDVAGTVDTSVSLTGLGTSTIRSAGTNTGTTYYVSTSTLIGYVGTPGPSAAVTSVDARNSRQVLTTPLGGTGSHVVASNGSTTVAGKVQTYGDSPTGTTAATPIITSALTDAVNGIYFLDLNAGVAGPDTLYLINTVQSQVQKWSFDGTAWTAKGTVSTGATGAANLTAGTDGTNVSLYLTSATTMYRLNDTSGAAGTLSGSLTTMFSAATNTAFRGLGNFNATFTAIPEPMSLGVFAFAGTLLGRRRR